MLERPDLSDPAIVACLRERYGLVISRLTFLPAGNDASAWAYRGDTADGSAYFVKVRRGRANPAGSCIPFFLHQQGISQVLGPLPAGTGELHADLAGFTVTVYPFVEGRTVRDTGMSAGHWVELGRALRRIHTAPLPAELLDLLPHETFRPAWLNTARRLRELTQTAGFDDPWQSELAGVWRSHAGEIDRILDRAPRLGHACRELARPECVCHADFHSANWLLDPAGRLFIVDWDGIILAPRERDLMFIGGEPGGPFPLDERQAHFYDGYGPVAVDRLVVAYYRYEWVVQELGDYGERVFFAERAGAATRREAVAGTRELFEPGNVVDDAFASDSPEFQL